MKRPSWIVNLIVAGVLGSVPFAASSAMTATAPAAADTAATAGTADRGAGGAQGAERAGTRVGVTAGAGGHGGAGTGLRTAGEADTGTDTQALTGTGTGTGTGTDADMGNGIRTHTDPNAATEPGGSDPGKRADQGDQADQADPGKPVKPVILKNDGWINTWTAMPQLTEPSNMPPAPFTQNGLVLDDSTLRQTVHVSVGGQQVRLRVSNEFGGAALPVTAVSVALPQGGKPGVAAIEAGSSRKVTFSGHDSITIPIGAQMVSDPLDFDVRPGSNLTVTIYLADGQASNDITSHPGSRTTSYMISGDHTDDGSLPGATTADHWYFLTGVEVQSKTAVGATVMLGDSLTDGRGSTTNGNDRWPDQLLTRLQANRATAGRAVLNEAAGGNAVLNGGLGPTALSRFDRDVLGQSGVTSLVIFEGVNDIGTAPATQAASQQVAQDLITAFDQMVTRAHAHGIKVYGATITPFGGNTAYDDAGGLHEAARQTVNDWMRTSGTFDAVVDLDEAAADPANPRRLNPAFEFDGDHLHMNPAGYGALAGAFPLELFR